MAFLAHDGQQRRNDDFFRFFTEFGGCSIVVPVVLEIVPVAD